MNWRLLTISITLLIISVNIFASTNQRTITGNILVDANENAIFDIEENGLDNVQIDAFRDANQNGILDDSDFKIASTTANSNGSYSLLIEAPFTETLSYKIAASSDDVEQTYPDTEMLLNDERAQGYREVGLRFQDIQIPARAQIKSASLKVTMDLNVPFISMYVEGEATDNAKTFTNELNNLGSRPRTNASFEWYRQTEITQDLEVEIEGLESIIQEIVERDGWVNGNALTLMLGDFDGSIHTFDANKPAELTITFEHAEEQTVDYIIAPNFDNLSTDLELLSESYKTVYLDRASTLVESVDFRLKEIDNAIVEPTDFIIDIYPTLTTGNLSIDIKGERNQWGELRIIAIDGKLMMQLPMELNNGLEQLDLSNLCKGTYVVQIATDQVLKTEKIIFQ